MRFAVEHIGLAATDTVALKDWYCRVLHAEIALEIPQQPPAFLLRCGGALFEIYPAKEQTDLTQNNSVAGWRHLALKVPSLDEARDWLASQNVNIEEPIKPAGGGGRVLFFRDLEGNLLHLVERPSGHTAF